MSAKLWIEEAAGQHDDESVKLAKLLAEVLNMLPDVRAELELVEGLDLGDVPWPVNEFKARIFWSTYVLDLRGSPVLKDLVKHMATRFPPRTAEFRYFLELRRTTGPRTWYDPPSPLEAQFVGSGAAQPMINRRKLRDELTKLHEEGYRTLNITGAAESGKSFSYQLVQGLADQEDLPLILVDIAEWGTEPFFARDLVDRIAGQLKIKVDTEHLHSVPDPNTRARLLMFALRDEFPASKKPRWIMVDGLDRANVQPDARAFVEKFLQSIDVNGQPTNVRLVVTGFTGKLPPQTCRDSISAITYGDVRELFAQVALSQLGNPASDAKLDEWADTVWSAYRPPEHTLTDLGASIYELVRGKVLARIEQPA